MTPECSEREDPYAARKTLNVVLLGLVFMLLASRTPISIVKTVLYSATDVSGVGYIEGFNGDGYVANAILYSTFAVSNFLAPWLISIIGPKYVPKTMKDDGSEQILLLQVILSSNTSGQRCSLEDLATPFTLRRCFTYLMGRY